MAYGDFRARLAALLGTICALSDALNRVVLRSSGAKAPLKLLVYVRAKARTLHKIDLIRCSLGAGVSMLVWRSMKPPLDCQGFDVRLRKSVCFGRTRVLLFPVCALGGKYYAIWYFLRYVAPGV